MTENQIKQLVLIDRLIAPALGEISSIQAKDIYAALQESPEFWPHDYKSYAHLCRLLGLVPLKGCV